MAHGPRLANEARARGLRLHIGSSHDPGASRDTADVRLTMAPNKRNTARNVMPMGRRWLLFTTARLSADGGNLRANLGGRRVFLGDNQNKRRFRLISCLP